MKIALLNKMNKANNYNHMFLPKLLKIKYSVQLTMYYSFADHCIAL